MASSEERAMPATERGNGKQEEDMAAEALSTLNPRIPIVSQVVQTGAGAEFRVHVFRDDVLAGGTKQRAIGCLIEQSQAQEFVYAGMLPECLVHHLLFASRPSTGPVNGFAQLALAVAARHYQRKATVVVAAQRDRSLHLLSSRAQDFGAKVQPTVCAQSPTHAC